jgi:hypothetical protein
LAVAARFSLYIHKRHFFLEIYFDAAQFPPAAVWPNAVLCIYTALLCDNAAVLLENIRENVEMISKRKGRRNGALPTVRRSIATAANFFFLYCYMCCSSRAFYILHVYLTRNHLSHCTKRSCIIIISARKV